MSVERGFREAWRDASEPQRYRLVRALRELAVKREDGNWDHPYALLTENGVRARIRQWLSDDDRHRLPAEVLRDAIECFGHARFLEPLHATKLRVLRERDRAAMAQVRREREEEDAA